MNQKDIQIIQKKMVKLTNGEPLDGDEIKDKITKKMEEIEYFFDAYDDGESFTREFEDDCFLHICRGKYRFIFYNGQEQGYLKETDIKKYSKLVDEKLQELIK